ncbi:MAG TPA: hypothetical protein VNO33_06700 [Kofleriaceae bacterium]|nr:hypothetical protein [Kofleriaceae bacterium]
MRRSIQTVAAAALLLLLSCSQDKGEEKPATPAEKPAAPAVTGESAAPAGEPAASEEPKSTQCADFAACRDGCAERKASTCLRMQGRARKPDRAEAEKLAARLCDAGHPEACHVQSLQLEGKRGQKALTRACELGYGQSCIQVAAKTKDRAKADLLHRRGLASLEKNCRQQEDPYACTGLAKAALAPPADEQADPARARWHYNKACDLGDEDACYELARMNVESPARNVALLDRACELGQPIACARIGDHYAEGKLVRKSMERAAASWKLACDSEAEAAHAACDSLAAALLDGRLPRDEARAAELKKRGQELAGSKKRK